MKSLISLILIIMLLSFSACGTEKTPENTSQITESPSQIAENEVIEMSFKDKVLNGLTDDGFDVSLANEGNADRIKALMKKAENLWIFSPVFYLCCLFCLLCFFVFLSLFVCLYSFS